MFRRMSDSRDLGPQVNLEKFHLMMKIQKVSLVLKEVYKRAAYPPLLPLIELLLLNGYREQSQDCIFASCLMQILLVLSFLITLPAIVNTIF